jgi:myosin heavy subunit
METLEETTPFFVRCINPNKTKSKRVFDREYVRPQLR